MALTSLANDLEFQYWMRDVFAECLRVLKPGGYLLAFSAARTYHHMALAAQTAGYEVRDQLMWIYGSGFPKSQDIGRQLHKKANGKPDKQRFDPSIMIKIDGDQYRHPTNGKLYRALPDINGDRLAVSHEGTKYGTVYEEVIEVNNAWSGWGTCLKPAHEPIVLARKPTKLTYAKNVQQWGTGALNIDATRIPMSQEDIDNDRIWKERYSAGNTGSPTFVEDDIHSQRKTQGGQTLDPVTGRFPSNVIGEFPDDIQKYFYCPKVSRKERHVGFDSADTTGNNHPTVKPIALMEYLIKLVTPAGGLVLDPFNGSGSTGMAAVGLGYDYVGIDLDSNYVDIANKRIQAWLDLDKADNNFDELFEEDYE
jgi:site-specific DNA-methyltransferase (adenine-specific)